MIKGVTNSAGTGLEEIYPVGSIYMNASNSSNPATLFGFGTWQALAPGRVLMGAGNSSYTAGNEYGEYSHTLTTTEMPSHGHSVSVNGTNTDHTHSGTTGGMSANSTHSHSGWTDYAGEHQHDIQIGVGYYNDQDNWRTSRVTGTQGDRWNRRNYNNEYTNIWPAGNHRHPIASADLSHTHGFTTGNVSANSSHGHTVNQSNSGGGLPTTTYSPHWSFTCGCARHNPSHKGAVM